MRKKRKRTFYIISFFICIFSLLIFAWLFYNVKFPLKYNNAILFYSKEYNLEPTLVASIINEESSFNPKAISNSGALGLMQIQPNTAKYIASEILKEEYNKEKLFLPETNIKYGCSYLAYLNKKFNSIQEVLCAYNAGETTVLKWLDNKELSTDGKTLYKIPYRVTDVYISKIIKGEKYYKGRI